MIIKLPKSVRYPITISELLKKPNDDVPRLTPLLVYTYRTTITEYPEYGVEVQVEKVLSSQFDAPVGGKLEKWFVETGTVVDNSSVAILEIEEPCTHGIQFAGLCTMCGEDMTLGLDYNSYFSNSDRATIKLAHDSNGLTVSEDEARKLEQDAKRRLLKSRKLSLVVDLDQTIIHATVDPTVGEWKDDPFCVNHDSVKDVQAFKLDEDVSGGRGTWYYVKMRPGLKEFLEHISKLFELHIYTMGTRAYALSVKKIVDPDGSIFGERVLSRDESGSMTQKSLHRLFPVDTKMVVIIDDRGDVWKWSESLIKVRPYDFFVGIGDINSMFLPKKQEFPSVPTGTLLENNSSAKQEGTTIEKKSDKAENSTGTNSQLSTLEQLITMGSGNDQQLITDQTHELDRTIEAQKEDRPLAKKQELQDKIDEKAAELAATTENGESSKDVSSDGGAPKHSVLRDNDTELFSLQQHLSTIHGQFYRDYEKNKGNRKDRVSQLRDGRKNPRKRSADGDDGLDLDAVPDVATIMPAMKRQALEGVVLVFSGVIPLGADIQSSDIAIWAKSFGVLIVESISPRVTHVIAARSRTAKVRQATRFSHIKIVNPGWLYDSISHWRHEPEEPYLIVIHPEDRHIPAPSLNGVEDSSGPLLSSEDESDDGNEGVDSEFGPNCKRGSLDMSNVEWDGVDEEFAEYFGDDDFLESDNESVRSERTDIELKRKRPDDTEAEGGAGDGGGSVDGDNGGGLDDKSEDTANVTGSRLAKRQKIARERAAAGSALRGVEISMESADGINNTNDNSNDDDDENGDDENDDGHDYEDYKADSDSLADELERELLSLENNISTTPAYAASTSD